MKQTKILAALGALALAVTGRAAAAAPLTLEAASSPPAYVTDSDVVVRVRGAAELKASAVHFGLNGHAVSPRNAESEGGALFVTIAGLRAGANLLEARAGVTP